MNCWFAAALPFKPLSCKPAPVEGLSLSIWGIFDFFGQKCEKPFCRSRFLQKNNSKKIPENSNFVIAGGIIEKGGLDQDWSLHSPWTH